jgi:hypothetical protein
MCLINKTCKISKAERVEKICLKPVKTSLELRRVSDRVVYTIRTFSVREVFRDVFNQKTRIKFDDWCTLLREELLDEKYQPVEWLGCEGGCNIQADAK